MLNIGSGNWKLSLNNIFHNFPINAEIVVDKLVSHAGHCLHGIWRYFFFKSSDIFQDASPMISGDFRQAELRILSLSRLDNSTVAQLSIRKSISPRICIRSSYLYSDQITSFSTKISMSLNFLSSLRETEL